MFLKTTQKFFSVRNKFSIVNINDDQLFFALERFKVRQNCTLYNMDGSVIYELECKILSIYGKYFIKDYKGNVVGTITGKFHKPFVQKWFLEINDSKFVLRSGGLHCKIFRAGENWKFDSKTDQIGYITKRIGNVKDTYEIEFDEKRLSEKHAALCMIWMDCRFHGEHHQD